MESPDRPSRLLLDSLQDSLIAVAEIGGNRLLGLDEDALAECRDMQGHCIAFDITDLDFCLYCHPGAWGIRLSRQPPAREVDARVSGRLVALLDLASQDDKVSTSIRERVSFDGNVALAQRLQRLLANIDLDWEEALAARSGDVFAHQFGQQARRLRDWLASSADSLLMTSSEYLREEAGLSPTEAEFEDFQSRLAALRHDVGHVEARLQRLVDRIGPR